MERAAGSGGSAAERDPHVSEPDQDPREQERDGTAEAGPVGSAPPAAPPRRPLPPWAERAPLLPAFAVGGALVVLAFSGGLVLALSIGALVVVHEVGHVQAARRLGLAVGRYAFVPFTRRALAPESVGRSRVEQVEVALGGPIYGLVLCVPAVALAFLVGGPGLRGAVFLWAGLNLVNLLPLHPFDGGRIAQGVASALHPFAGLALAGAGTAALAAAALATGDSVVLIVGALSVFEFLREYDLYGRYRRLAGGGGGAPSEGAHPPGPDDLEAFRLFRTSGFDRGRLWAFAATWMALAAFYGAATAVALYSGQLGAPLGPGWGLP